MYCSQCGIQNDNSARFCTNCGQKLEVSQEKNESSANNNSCEKSYVKPEVKYSGDPVLNAVKKLVLSPISLVAAVAFSLMIIFNISNAEVLSTNLLGYISQVFEASGIYELSSLRSELYELSGFFRLFVTIGMVPEIVIAIGIWMTVYTSFQKGDEFSLSGMKAIKVISVISFIFAICSFVASLGLSLWLIQLVADTIKILPVGFFIIIFAIIGILGFTVYYKKQIINVIDCFISTVNGRTPYVPGKFVAVMCFFSCGAYVISGIMSSSAAIWCSAISALCFGVLIIQSINVLNLLRPKSRLLNEIENCDETTTVHEIKNQDEEPIVKVYQPVSEKDGSNNKKVAAVIAGIVVAIILAIFISSTSVAPGIDKDIVGKWSYGNSAETTFQFKRTGVFIGNEGTEYEERGTYTASDGVISVVIDGEVVEHEYRVIDSDKIQIYRSYITSNWERKYRWETLYRID